MKILLLCGLYCLPLKSLHINSPYGYRVHPLSHLWTFHAGIDLAARNDTVYSVTGGKVSLAGYSPTLGFRLEVTGTNGLAIVYAHLSMLWVRPGEEVTAGQALGMTGKTGRVTGEHLHLEIRYHHQSLDPLLFIRALTRVEYLINNQ